MGKRERERGQRGEKRVFWADLVEFFCISVYMHVPIILIYLVHPEGLKDQCPRFGIMGFGLLTKSYFCHVVSFLSELKPIQQDQQGTRKSFENVTDLPRASLKPLHKEHEDIPLENPQRNYMTSCGYGSKRKPLATVFVHVSFDQHHLFVWHTPCLDTHSPLLEVCLRLHFGASHRL